MPYSPDPVLEQYIIEPGGENDVWGDLINTNLRRLAEAIHDRVLHTFVGGEISYTLDDTDYTGTESHKSLLHTAGTPTNNVEVIVPNRPHIWHCYNDVAAPRLVTIKTSVGGAPHIDLSNGERAILFVLPATGGVHAFWRNFDFLLADGSISMNGPLNMQFHEVINLPYPGSVGSQAANTQWVNDLVNQVVVAALAVRDEQRYPVGAIYINAANAANPSAFGFPGTWVPYGGGTFLACAGSHTDPDGRFLNIPTAVEAPPVGLPNIRIQQGNLPATLNVPAVNPSDNTGGYAFLEASSGTSVGAVGTVSVPVGSGVEMTNMPPLSVVYVWRRVA